MKLFGWMCFFLVISVAGSSVVQGQTIADAARQERERRKAVESETGESIPVVTSVTTVPARIKAATINGKSKSSGPTDLQGHDEKYWRPKFDAARLAVKRAEDNLKLLDLKATNQNSVLIPGRSTTALQKATHDRDVARNALADAQQKIAGLEEQLRRSGGPPGWSRPL
jgi:hypothetical protein